MTVTVTDPHGAFTIHSVHPTNSDSNSGREPRPATGLSFWLDDLAGSPYTSHILKEKP